jgi:hypothetical protein
MQDAKFSIAFYFALRNTLVAKDLTTASRIAFSVCVFACHIHCHVSALSSLDLIGYGLIVC